MKCTCPKCNVKIQLDLPNVSEEGASSTCTECKARFLVYKEPFAGRALRKTGEVSCSHCGEELGPYLHCPACGVLYPDYYVAQSGLKRAPKKRELVSLKESFSFDLGTKKVDTASPEQTYAVEQRPGNKSSNLVAIVVSGIMVIALLAAGVTIYNNKKMERQYAASYVIALYGIKSGSDLNLTKCAKISAEWKSKLDSGQSFTPRISAGDEADLTTVKNEIDGAMQKLRKTPKKFAAANDKLINLHGVYAKSLAATLAPSGTPTSFTDSVSKVENEFNLAVKDLKANLPEELKDEVRRVLPRYNGLKFMTE